MWKLLFLAALLISSPVFAIEDTLTNIRRSPEQTITPAITPGTIIIMPDGRNAIIQGIRQDGNYETDLGVILTPQGIIAEGPDSGKSVVIAPEQNNPAPETAIATPKAEIPQNRENTIALPVTPIPPKAQDTPAAPPAPATQNAPEQITLAELLPMTTVPEKTPAKEQPKKAAPEEKKPVPEKLPQKKEESKAPAQKQEKPVKKAEKPQKQPEKTAPGKELRIPPEAAKKGDLSFLEGCWQGTRPEYYSKRTIKECFCFGANGKNGKRRVFDPLGKRQCIGATNATLSANGVLSVRSSGAACSDGERWGQAEMVCRNSGPRTPCSWVFRDAQNGRQSYEIPFIRVESCGK